MLPEAVYKLVIRGFRIYGFLNQYTTFCCYTFFYEEVRCTNIVYKCLLPEDVCCCLQIVLTNMSLYITLVYIPNFVVVGRSIEELWAQT